MHWRVGWMAGVVLRELRPAVSDSAYCYVRGGGGGGKEGARLIVELRSATR